MRKPILAILAAILASLACTQAVVIPTPTVSPTLTHTPQPTATLAATPLPSAEAQTAVIKAATVNVRAEPNGEVVGQLQAGASVTVVTCADSWCQIEKPAGWVFEGCLSISDGKGCEAK